VPSVVSLFSGCSGSDLGFDQAGFDVIFANEFDASACDSYQANFGVRPIEVPLGEYLGATEASLAGFLTASAVERLGPEGVDVLIGGPPCPTFSSMRFVNRRTAEGLPRVVEMQEATRRVRPKIVICENVPTLLGPKLEIPYKFFIDGFASLGYKMNTFVLNATDYGLPQDRERLFMVGVREDIYARGVRFCKPEGKHYKAVTSGWGEYLGIPTNFVLLSTLSSTRGRKPDMAAFTVIGCRNLCIREVGDYLENKRTSALLAEERLLIGQRTLNERELAKLQGFPPNYVFCGIDERVYKQIGNAWAVPVANALAKECIRCLGT
jgi:DNA (cytosine-5)-methyltransferase 1